MSTTVAPGLLGTVWRRIVALLDAWSYRIARARAERRRQMLLARKAGHAAKPLWRWPSSWGD